MKKITVVVQSCPTPELVVGRKPVGIDVRMAGTANELRGALPGAEILFGFDFKGKLLPQVWDAAADLRWIQWAGAGVDALLFPDLVNSDVVVTNAGGIYDDAIAEHVLALMLAQTKRLPDAVRNQLKSTWHYQTVNPVRGSTALVLGAGGIGRAIARLLGAVGVNVTLIATSTRPDDEFGGVIAWQDRDLSRADWLVVAAPLTSATRHIVDRAVLAELPPSASLINIGRGASVDEVALVAALNAGELAGAGLDVFETEPLPSDSPLWRMENVIITPHHAGDLDDYAERVAELFLENLVRYQAGQPLLNTIDKRLGYRSSV
ncbi:MAG: D-2-hydroxyacid dehydrogenase [Acidimicrobiia bacterium]|nr:D-2-hydroxyacid dehydrogenase [Acidimicrobiia bacterium]MDH5504347.1 D-2-hydroxyacid dehydrogenase [Acidimicrobiia bacterium]